MCGPGETSAGGCAAHRGRPGAREGRSALLAHRVREPQRLRVSARDQLGTLVASWTRDEVAHAARRDASRRPRG
eukprot:2400125-Prymnesium_polylepis.1